MILKNLKYSKEHEWVLVDGNTATIGITHYAQDSLGDIVYLELPEVGRQLEQMEDCGVVESVKTVSPIYCPISGEVTERNQDAIDGPELVNESPYGDGWLFRVKISTKHELDDLLSADDYEKLLKDL